MTDAFYEAAFRRYLQTGDMRGLKIHELLQKAAARWGWPMLENIHAAFAGGQVLDVHGNHALADLRIAHYSECLRYLGAVPYHDFDCSPPLKIHFLEFSGWVQIVSALDPSQLHGLAPTRIAGGDVLPPGLLQAMVYKRPNVVVL